jgi:hypothetical protein
MVRIGIVLAIVRLLMAFGVITLEGHLLAGYTAVAHIFIGVVGWDWWLNRYKFRESYTYWLTHQPWQFRLFCAMNAVELFSFFYSRS